MTEIHIIANYDNKYNIGDLWIIDLETKMGHLIEDYESNEYNIVTDWTDDDIEEYLYQHGFPDAYYPNGSYVVYLNKYDSKYDNCKGENIILEELKIKKTS